MRAFLKKYWKQLIVVSVSTLIALIFGEVITRISSKAKYAKRINEWDHEIYVIDQSSLFYTLKPNLKRHNRIRPDLPRSWWMTLNADGFRGPDPVKGKKTILFLGDSFTFGWGLDDHDVFPAVIRAELSQDYKGYQVINGGVPGYNTIQEYQLLKRHWDKWQPKLVLLSYVINDAEPQMSVPAPPRVKMRHHSSWLWVKTCRQVERVFSDEKGWLAPKLYENDPNFLTAFADKGVKWKESKEALRLISELCREKKVPFALVMLPNFASPFGPGYQYQPIHDAVQQWAREFHIEHFDQLDHFKATDNKELMIPNDGHPNKVANQRIAREILDKCIFPKIKRDH
jgi:lysophospholipase L1-like esterase